jgi:molybdopterin-guanine dinucleotide biosynthesis protein A
MIDIDAFILIGGRSSRLGRDKAVAELGGKTLAQRAFQTATEALPTSRVTFVAANEAQFGIDAIAAGGPFIFDLIPDRGPLGGLHAALAYARTPWIFVLACDYPFVTSELIRFLTDKVSDNCGAVVPKQDDGRLQPLCAFYKTEAARPLVQEIIDRPRVPPPMSEIVKELEACIVSFAEISHLSASSDFFVNVNTQPDLDHAGEIERKLSALK